MDLKTLSEEKESQDKNENIRINHAYQHNVYLKQMDFDEPNMTYCGHHHEYDHVTLVASGRVRVTFGAVPFAGIPEEVKEYSAVSMFVTRSFRLHTIVSLEPNTTVCCVHAIRTKDGNILEPDIPKDHYFDPDFKNDVSQGKKGIAFNAFEQPIILDKLVKQAEQDGVLKPGSQDELLN